MRCYTNCHNNNNNNKTARLTLPMFMGPIIMLGPMGPIGPWPIMAMFLLPLLEGVMVIWSIWALAMSAMLYWELVIMVLVLAAMEAAAAS